MPSRKKAEPTSLVRPQHHAHVASLRWQGGSDVAQRLPTAPHQATSVLPPQHVPPFQPLRPATDLNVAPHNWLTAAPFEAAVSPLQQPRSDASPSALEPWLLPPVARERDWGTFSGSDIFSALRTDFSSSVLAGIGSDSPVHFIAPAEDMKRVFTLPYSSESRTRFLLAPRALPAEEVESWHLAAGTRRAA